jgi:hypothetical protein
VNRFDSVSTVLADPRWFESEKEIFERDDGTIKKSKVVKKVVV